MKFLKNLLIFFTFAVFQCCNGGDDPVLDGAISGTVTNSLTGEPVDNATITLSGFEQKTLITGSDGTFRFDNLTIGTYGIAAQNNNFQSNTINVTLQSLEAVTADIALEPIPPIELSPTKLDFGLSKTELSIVIKNTGSETINYEVQSPNEWISMSKSSGTLQSQNSDAFLITVNRSSLASGNQEGSITYNVPGRGSINQQILISKE